MDVVFDRKGNTFTYRTVIPKGYRFWSWGPNNTILLDDLGYGGPPHPYLDSERSDVFLYDWQRRKPPVRLGEVERIGTEGVLTSAGTVFDSLDSYDPSELNEYSLKPFELLRRIPLPVVKTEGSGLPTTGSIQRYAVSFDRKTAYSNVIRFSKTDKPQGPLKLKTEFLLEIRLRDLGSGADGRVAVLPVRPTAKDTDLRWLPSRQTLFVSLGEDMYLVRL